MGDICLGKAMAPARTSDGTPTIINVFWPSSGADSRASKVPFWPDVVMFAEVAREAHYGPCGLPLGSVHVV